MLQLFKMCPKCGQEKLFTDFHNYSRTKDGKSGYCKLCSALASKKFSLKEEAKNRSRSYAKKHHERLREIAKQNAKNKPWVRITKTLTSKLRKYTSFRSPVKTKLIKAHFESLMPLFGMTWENYGTIWQTKRIKPILEFDLSSSEEVAKINELSNLTIRIIPENERSGYAERFNKKI
jgi:ribosomal protein S27AE